MPLPLRLVMASTLLLLPGAASALKCPNLHLVVDRSNSMLHEVGNRNRWQIARAAIQRVLDQYGRRMPIGLTIFPRDECGVEDPIPPTLKVAEIARALDARGPGGGTPMHAAILRTARLPELQDPDRRHYMILVTDGLPECNGDPTFTLEAAITALRSAYEQRPSIATFVVGFGGDVDPMLKAALTRLAEAGGRPAPTPEKYYAADDPEALRQALQKILTVIMDEFGDRLCDESCSTNGCPGGQVCLRSECVRDPCGGVECGPGLYCYTDGVSPGVCRKACLLPCPQGARCSMGSCIEDPCGNVCLPGTYCNAAARRCEPDPQCAGPMAPACEAPAQCQGGRCALDPCLFVRCPPGSDCVPWDGSCAANAAHAPGGEREARGCAALPGASAGGGPLLLLGLLLLAGRRPRR